MKMAYISESTVSIAKVKSKQGSKTEGRGHRERRTHRSEGSHRKRRTEQVPEKDDVVYVYRVRADRPGSTQDADRRRSMPVAPQTTPETISGTETIRRVASVRKRSTPDARRSPRELPTISSKIDRKENTVTEKGVETTLRRSQSAKYPPTRPVDGTSDPRTLRYVITSFEAYQTGYAESKSDVEVPPRGPLRKSNPGRP